MTDIYKKARQARIGHRGHMLAATYSLEAGNSFLFYKKARQARTGHRGHMLAATYSLEAGNSFPEHKKTNRACSHLRKRRSYGKNYFHNGRGA
ncbi:MAG: hypothetical protein FWF77_02155 [Defluviitaleaceae bacterium]|nr:hypothetical protein [Defluviitaleaceae bacterium]